VTLGTPNCNSCGGYFAGLQQITPCRDCYYVSQELLFEGFSVRWPNDVLTRLVDSSFSLRLC